MVADQWQHIGIGSHLIYELIDAARRSGLRTMTGEILASNHEMLKLAEAARRDVIQVDDFPADYWRHQVPQPQSSQVQNSQVQSSQPQSRSNTP